MAVNPCPVASTSITFWPEVSRCRASWCLCNNGGIFPPITGLPGHSISVRPGIRLLTDTVAGGLLRYSIAVLSRVGDIGDLLIASALKLKSLRFGDQLVS